MYQLNAFSILKVVVCNEFEQTIKFKSIYDSVVNLNFKKPVFYNILFLTAHLDGQENNIFQIIIFHFFKVKNLAHLRIQEKLQINYCFLSKSKIFAPVSSSCIKLCTT